MRRSGKDWLKNESEVMDLLGLKQVPGSGSNWKAKEDGFNDEVLCQLKSTDASSIRVQKQDIDELLINAAVEYKLPVFAIQFRQSNEVYLLVRPLDLPDIAKYLKSGKYEAYPDIVEQDFKPVGRKTIKSNCFAREAFKRVNEEKYKKKGKKAK